MNDIGYLINSTETIRFVSRSLRSVSVMMNDDFSEVESIFDSILNSTSIDRNRSILNDSIEINLRLPYRLRTIATVICLIVLMFGIVGNLLVPLIVCNTRKLCNNSTNVFLINLSIADLLVLLVCMPTVLIELHSRPEVWMLGELMCKTVPFIELVVAHGSVLTILAISFERYYAICKPLKASYKCTNHRAILIVCGLWLIAIIATVPVLFGTELIETIYIDGSIVPVCLTKASSEWQRSYFIVSIIGFFCVPLIILLVIYFKITHRLTSDDHRLLIASIQSKFTLESLISSTKPQRNDSLASSLSLNQSINKEQSGLWRQTAMTAMFRNSFGSLSESLGFNQQQQQQQQQQQPNNLPQPPSNQRRNSSLIQAESVSRSRRQVIFMLAAVVICFFLCLLPFRLFTLWLLIVSDEEIRSISMEKFYTILYFCRVMIYVNSMLNPLLYAAVSSKFRCALMDTLNRFFGPNSLRFFYVCCCCYCNCIPNTVSTSFGDLIPSRHQYPRGILSNYRKNFLLQRQSTNLTTTTATTDSSSISLKNNSIRSTTTTSFGPQSPRYHSSDSLRSTRPRRISSSSFHQQSFESNQTSINSDCETEPSSPAKLNVIYSSQHSAEYRRKIMMKRSSRVFLIDEDGENKLAQSLERLKYQLRKDSIEEECEDDVNGETNESKWSHIRHNWLKQSISQQSSITPTNTALIVNSETFTPCSSTPKSYPIEIKKSKLIKTRDYHFSL